MFLFLCASVQDSEINQHFKALRGKKKRFLICRHSEDQKELVLGEEIVELTLLEAGLEWNSELSAFHRPELPRSHRHPKRLPWPTGGGELLRFPSCWQESEVNSFPSEEGGGCKTQKGEKWIHISLSDVKSPMGRVSFQTGDLPGTLPENYLTWGHLSSQCLRLKTSPVSLSPSYLFVPHPECAHTLVWFSHRAVLDIILAVFVHSRLTNPDFESQLKCPLLHFMREQH